MRTRARSNRGEQGVALVETILSLSVLIPLLGGMLLIGQLSQERALVSQALRSSVRPVSLFEAIDHESAEPGSPGIPDEPVQLLDIYDGLCSLLDLTLSEAHVAPSDYTLTLSVSQVGDENERKSLFLSVSAVRNAASHIPFYGELPGRLKVQTLFPIRIAGIEDAEMLPEDLQSFTCGE